MPDEFAAVATIAIFGLPAGAWVAVRMMEHFERMEMIRRGMIPPSAFYRAAVLPPRQPPSLDACISLSRGIMLGAMAIVLLSGLACIVAADDFLLPGPHWTRIAAWLPALLGLAFLVRRSFASRRLRHKTIRDAGASLKLP